MNISKETREKIDARHEQVLGQPPRIAPSDRQEVAGQVQATTQKLRGGVVADQPPLPLDAIPEIMFTMCRFPDLWDKMIELTLEIQGANATLDLRDRRPLICVIASWRSCGQVGSAKPPMNSASMPTSRGARGSRMKRFHELQLAPLVKVGTITNVRSCVP